MFDFENIYNEISDENTSHQKKLEIDSALGIFYGISEEGYYRLSFVSKKIAPKMDSTKLLRVIQGAEKDGIYWTCFDLLNLDIKKVFYTFCANLIEAVTLAKDESLALDQLKKRYLAWKTMFKNEIKKSVPKELIQGLYGELYFLRKYMEPRYGVDYAVKAWAGPDGKSKDFTIEDTWYEIKTVGVNSQSAIIHSLAQLSSENEGHLVVLRAEGMSSEFSNGESSIGELLNLVLEDIHNPIIENEFLIKFGSYGVDITDDCVNEKFCVKNTGMSLYKVNDEFPRLTEVNVPFTEIVSAVYELSLSAIAKYKEDV